MVNPEENITDRARYIMTVKDYQNKNKRIMISPNKWDPQSKRKKKEVSGELNLQDNIYYNTGTGWSPKNPGQPDMDEIYDSGDEVLNNKKQSSIKKKCNKTLSEFDRNIGLGY